MKCLNLCVVVTSLLSVFMVRGQQAIIDSLERELDYPTNDLSKVEVLNELGWYYALSDPNKGFKKADQAIALAKETNDSIQLGIAYERKGYNYQNSGNDSLTVVYYTKAGEIYREIGDTGRLAGLTYNTGSFYFYRSKYVESLERVNKALQYYSKEKDSVKMARIYNMIALNHMYLGDYTASMQTFQKGALILELTKNKESQPFAEIQGNLALLYEKMSDFEKALYYQNAALKIHEKNNSLLGISNTYANIGQIYGHLNQQEKALEMFNKSLVLKNRMGNKYRIANGLTNLGTTYMELKKYDKAHEFLAKAKSLYEDIQHTSNLSQIHKVIGELYLVQRRTREAVQSFDLALEYAIKSEDKRAYFLAKEGLARAAYLNSDFEKAYRLQEEVFVLKDSLLSTEKRDELAKLEAKYEYEKEGALLQANFEKEKAISEAAIEKEIMVRNISIGGGIVGMLILAAGFTLIRRKKEVELNSKIAISELGTLRAQLNPHFIFNTLNSINNYIINNEKQDASSYLIRFSKMMRKILENSNEEEVQLADEIEFLENYIKLEQERLGNKFSYSIRVDDRIKTDETWIPPSLLQPFVENSIWHGLSEKEGGDGQLTIAILKKEKNLLCIIEDNGLGVDPSKKKIVAEHKSFGIGSVRNRLALFNKIKGSPVSRLDVIDKKEGFRVEIQIPLILDSQL